MRSLLLAISLLCAGAQAAEPITVAWRNKPPYHYYENGNARGFLLERVQKAFENAGVPANFVEEPSKRIWTSFASGRKDYCSIGWYRLPEREAIVQFSSVIHVDRPHTVLAAPSARDKVMKHRTVQSLTADRNLVLGVVDGVSYGPQLDSLIKASQNKIDRKVVEPPVMVRSVIADRISFMFIDQDDWEYARDHEDGLKRATQVDFPDMPQGMSRYLVCSKDVPAETMAKLNRAIDALLKK